MSDILVIGGGFGGTYFAKKVAAPLLTRSNGHDISTGNGLAHILDRASRAKVIVNFASQSMVGESWQRPWDWMQTNCTGTSALIVGLQKQGCIEKYIHFTTPEVYGSTDGWVTENWDFRPSTPYAVSRAAGDWMVKLWQQQYGFPALFTRAANIYGEGQQLYRIIPKATLYALQGKKLPLHGGGKSIRSFIHMDDVCTALMRLIEVGTVGQTYHIGPHESVSIKDLVEMIGCDYEVTPDRAGKDERYLLDPSRMMGMGWEPKVSLASGLRRVREYVTNHQDGPTEYKHAA